MARVLIGNFKGPKGDKGDQGATGAKGEQGIQGPVGPAGGVNSVNGGQGDVVVGGVNLLRNSLDPYVTAYAGSTVTKTTGISVPEWGAKDAIRYEGTSGTERLTVILQNYPVNDLFSRNEKYCISMFIRNDGETNVSVGSDTFANVPPGESKRISVVQIHPEIDISTIYKQIQIRTNATNTPYNVVIWHPKIEFGTVATEWSPAPEDLAYNWQIEGILPHRYVARWDKAQHTMTRMYDAAGITTDTTHFCHRGSVDSAYSNPFDSIYPWSHRKLCKADKAKYKQLYEAGGDVLEAITMWEGDPGFKLGSTAPGMDMVYTPEFWMRQWEDSSYVYYGVADGPIYGWIHVPPMVQARYLASQDTSGGLTSLAGDVPYADTVSVGTLHTEAKKDSLTLDNIFTWGAETMLMIVEYADMNCQSAIGRSVDNLYRASSEHPTADGTAANDVTLPAAMKPYCIPGAVLDFATANDGTNTARRVVASTEDVSGDVKVTFSGGPVTYTTATFCSIHGLYNAPDEQIGSKSGYIGTNGQCLAYYRGRNNYGNCYHYLLGAYRQQTTGHIWVAPDEETADSLDGLDTGKCIDTGCALPNTANGAQADGYIKSLHLLPDYPAAPVCKTVGGNSTSPVGDYCWWPALTTGNTICLAGADVGPGLCVGRFTAYWRNASSSAWWSSAASLAFKSPKGGEFEGERTPPQ